MEDVVERNFALIKPNVDFISLRFVKENTENLNVRQNVLQPISSHKDMGAMITVIHNNGMGYAATSDLSLFGLKQATKQAQCYRIPNLVFVSKAK